MPIRLTTAQEDRDEFLRAGRRWNPQGDVRPRLHDLSASMRHLTRSAGGASHAMDSLAYAARGATQRFEEAQRLGQAIVDDTIKPLPAHSKHIHLEDAPFFGLRHDDISIRFLSDKTAEVIATTDGMSRRVIVEGLHRHDRDFVKREVKKYLDYAAEKTRRNVRSHLSEFRPLLQDDPFL